MHEQETFDAMVWHLRRQGQKSVNRVGDCLYRGPDGLMCAVGFLIPDAKYRRKLEGQSVEDGDVSNILAKYGHNLDLCYRMQAIHDVEDVIYWESMFLDVAKEFNLTYTPPA